jgi:biopolymer transport protein ExbD
MFTLTIFFMLVTHLSSAEQVRMELPKPEDSRAQEAKIPDRVVINCRPAEDGSTLYSLGPNQPEPLHVIGERLTAFKQQNPQLEAIIRADKRLRYEEVRKVMRLISQAEIKMLNVVAHVGDDQ